MKYCWPIFPLLQLQEGGGLFEPEPGGGGGGGLSQGSLALTEGPHTYKNGAQNSAEETSSDACSIIYMTFNIPVH